MDMNEKIENIVADYIAVNKLFSPGQKVVLAISGGADSVGLLQILNKLRTAGKIDVKLHLAHVNHHLRAEESDGDANFVASLAEGLALPLTIEDVDVMAMARREKLSIETAARMLRLNALKAVAKTQNASAILTAHHKDDNAETIIHRLLRGTGYTGLAGIRPKIEFQDGSVFVRPLLNISRKQIEDYLAKTNTNWRTDATNADCRFTRNHIRHKLVPLIEKGCQSPLSESLSILARHCCGLDEKLRTLTGSAWENCSRELEAESLVLQREAFLAEAKPVQIELIKKTLSQLNCGLRKFTFEHYNAILTFAKSAKPDKTLKLPNGLMMRVDSDEIIFCYAPSESELPMQPVQIQLPGEVRFGPWVIETRILSPGDCDLEAFKAKKDNCTEWFDLDAIIEPLYARRRRDGDKFIPFGHKSSKKAGKFLTSAKISGKTKKISFIIADPEKILWLAPVRGSGFCSVSGDTSRILQIKIFRKLAQQQQSPQKRILPEI